MAFHGSVANFSMFDNVSVANCTDGAYQTPFDAISENFASALYAYYTPVLVIFGSIGNLLSVFVFINSKLRFQSTSQYLSALALSDTSFLLQLIPPWLNAVHLTSLYTHDGFCQVFVYVSYVTCCLSAWLVLAFTVERFVAVLYPLHRNVLCTVKHARYIILVLTLFALVLNVPVLRFAIPTDDDCNIDHELMAFAARFNLVDTVISFTIPLAGIIVLNCWITVGVYRLERARINLVKEVRPTEMTGRALQLNLPVSPQSQHRITKMLLIVSSVFVLFNLPAYTMRLLTYAYNLNQRGQVGRWSALQQLALMAFHSNFGINFILYCLSGQNFRKVLRQTMRLVGWGRPAHHMDSSRIGRVSGSTSMISCTEPVGNCRTAATETVTTTTSATATTTRTINTTAVVESAGRQGRDKFIRRWKFDNSRQQRRAPQTEPVEIEMQVFSSNIMEPDE